MSIEIIFQGHESFVGLCFADLENETFSQHHCHNKLGAIFDFERFLENLKNGSTEFLDFFKGLTIYA